MYTVWYINMRNMTVSYGKSLYLIGLFCVLTTIYVRIDVSQPNFHRLSIFLMYIFWYINMPNMAACYGSFSKKLRFWEFFFKRYNFTKLLQIALEILTSVIIDYISLNFYFIAPNHPNHFVTFFFYFINLVFS